MSSATAVPAARPIISLGLDVRKESSTCRETFAREILESRHRIVTLGAGRA